MFKTVLLKRTMPPKSACRNLMRLALLNVSSSPNNSVKKLYHYVDSKPNYFQLLNSLPLRKEIHAKAFGYKEKDTKHNNEITELLSSLELHIKNFQRVKYKDAEMLLHFIKKGQVVESEKYSLLLLEWCCHSMPDVDATSRISFAHSVWEAIRSYGIGIGTVHYNTLLKCYAANGHKVSVQQFLADMGDIVPDNNTYELLLECACVSGDLEQGINVIQLMKDRNIPISESTFNSLILGHARAGSINSSLQTLEAMYAANLLPSANTYTAILQSYAEYGNFEQIKKTYEEAISKSINLSVPQALSICKILALKKQYKMISEFLDLLPNHFKKFTVAIQNTILEFIQLKHEEAAVSLIESILPEVSKAALEHPFAFLVSEMCRANIEPDKIINICCYLEEKQLYPRALYKAAEASLYLTKSEISRPIFLTLFKNGEVLRPHYFWPIFREKAKLCGEKGVLETLKDMVEMKVTPDYHTLVDYVVPMISTNNPEVAIQKLQSYGISVRESLTPIAATLLLSGRLQSLLRLCKSSPSRLDFYKLIQPLVDTFLARKQAEPVVSFLKVAAKHTTNDVAGRFILELLTIKSNRYRSEDIINLLQAFKKANIFVSSFAADVLTQYFKNGGTNSSSNQESTTLIESVTQHDLQFSLTDTGTVNMIHPRDMTLEELECHLVELKSKNMNTRGVLRRLLQLHMRERNVNRLMEVKKELDDEGFKFSPGMLSSLFSMYIQLKDRNSAGRILNEIIQQAPDFVMDEFKIVDYATLLVLENQYKAAVTVLEQRAGSGKVIGGENINRNCWQLLNALAVKGEAEKVKHMLHHLKTLGFCSVTNVLLGPLVRAHLVRGDTVEAVREYQNCAAQFKKTPLQQELLTHLVSKSSGSPSTQMLLEDTLASTVSVHGEANTFATFLVVLAECGKKKELQNFIMRHGANIHYEGLTNRIKQLAKEEKLLPLSILAEECVKLPNFNIITLYSYMLQVFDKQGDCEGALKLWTAIQEKNIQPSSAFIQSLTSMLKSHNKPFPTVDTDVQEH